MKYIHFVDSAAKFVIRNGIEDLPDRIDVSLMFRPVIDQTHRLLDIPERLSRRKDWRVLERLGLRNDFAAVRHLLRDEQVVDTLSIYRRTVPCACPVPESRA